MEDRFLTIQEVAKKLQISEDWVYRKCQARIMPHIRVGSIVRIRESALDKWIRDHEIKGALKI